jgi:iron(III) transport system substrate-binding protein
MRFSRRLSRPLLVSALIASVAALAACGSSGSSTSSSATTGSGSTSATSSATDVSPALLKAAQQEGEVVFYSALDTDILQQLATAFKAKYGITLAWKESASGATIEAASAQLSAGNVQTDVISITPDPKFQDKYASDFLTFSPSQMPALKGLPAGDYTSTYVQYILNYYGWVYNTNQLKASDLPSTLYGLANDPALKGKIGTANIAASNSYATFHAMLYDAWGASKWDTWIKGLLSGQQAQVGTSSAALANSVASGALEVFGPTHLGIVAALIKQGAPLAIKYYDPVMQLPDGFISFVKAPHPDAAKVFVNWMLSEQAQEIICGGSECASYLNLSNAIQKPTGVSIVAAPVSRGNALDKQLTATFDAASA